MKLEIKKGSENYCGSIVKLPYLQSVEGFDNLKMVTVFGNNCLVPKTYQQGELYIYFPFASVLSRDFLHYNNLYRDNTKNSDNTKKGYFSDSGKIKAEKMKGVISSCIVLPISSLNYLNILLTFNEGDEFTHIDGVEICKKFKIQNASVGKQERTSTGKVENKFDKLVPNQFRFHESTAHFMKCISHFDLYDVISITDKLHGCVSSDTKIETLEFGEKTIKEIVDQKLDCRIKAFDIEKQEVVYTPIEQYYLKKQHGEWLEIELEDGKKIEITTNNPVWLPELNCYRIAKELIVGDILFVD